MECPKCGGGAFLSEEELIKILEGTEPLRMIIKSVYQCRACMEKFSRLVSDNIEARRRESGLGIPLISSGSVPVQKSNTDVVEGIRFF